MTLPLPQQLIFEILLRIIITWFSRLWTRLDENLSDPDVFADLSQRGLHRLSGPEDRNATDLFHGAPFTLVYNTLGCVDADAFVGKKWQSVFDDLKRSNFEVE